MSKSAKKGFVYILQQATTTISVERAKESKCKYRIIEVDDNGTTVALLRNLYKIGSTWDPRSRCNNYTTNSLCKVLYSAIFAIDNENELDCNDIDNLLKEHAIKNFLQKLEISNTKFNLGFDGGEEIYQCEGDIKSLFLSG